MFSFVPTAPTSSFHSKRYPLSNLRRSGLPFAKDAHSTYPRHHRSIHASYTPPPSSPDQANGKQGSKHSDKSMDWQEELRLLLDPTMSLPMKQVLIQDFAKRLPDVLKSPCARGVEDVFRQLTEDVLPDLISNGPRYVTQAVEQTTNCSANQQPPPPSFSAPPSVSVEEVTREFRNVFNRTPEGLYTPEFKTLFSSSEKSYQIRRYPTVIIAETSMDPKSTTTGGSKVTEVESATAMGQSFNTLAGFLFGKNASKTEMKMTTPVMLSKGSASESMSFIIGEYEKVEDVPKTLDESVRLREERGSVYAVIEFSGFVTVGEVKRQREKLMKELREDGVKVTDQGADKYKCMIYNGPSTLPNLRRNELMIEVEDV